MKFTIDQADFIGALGLACGVIAKRNTIPVLECVLLNATMMGLVISATDQENGITYTCEDAITEDDGTCAINGAWLKAVVATLPEGPIECEVEGTRFTMIAGQRKVQHAIVNAGDFPAIESVTGANIVLTAAHWKGLLDPTVFACSKDPGRASLHGVHLEHVRGSLVACGTTGVSLAESRLPYAMKAPPALIHATAVNAWLTMLDDVDGTEPVTVTIGDSVAQITVGPAVHTTRLMAFKFPDYASAMPKYNQPTVKVDTAALVGSLKGLLATYEGSGNPVIGLNLSGNVLNLSIKSDLAEATDAIAVEYAGHDAETWINPQSVLDGLAHCGKVAILNLESRPQPLTMKHEGDAAWFYLSMPIVPA